jgi:hypothetical protein
MAAGYHTRAPPSNKLGPKKDTTSQKQRGFTLVAYFKFVKDRKSAILGVWAAPGATETLPKGSFCKALRGPRGRPDPQNDRLPIRTSFQNFTAIQNAATLIIEPTGALIGSHRHVVVTLVTVGSRLEPTCTRVSHENFARSGD